MDYTVLLYLEVDFCEGGRMPAISKVFSAGLLGSLRSLVLVSLDL